MASNINPYSIDGTFPVAGQDNSSQGFRDNFTNVKNNFIYAQSEINDLQQNSILKSAVSGTLDNDMAGVTISRPQLKSWTQTINDLGNATAAAELDFSTGNFQKIRTAGTSIVVSFTSGSWPITSGSGATGYAVMRLWIYAADTSHTVTLPASVSIGTADIANLSAGNILTFPAIGDYVYEFSSVDNGGSFLITDITSSRTKVYGNLTVTGSATITGNVVRAGGVADQGYTFLSAPSTSFWANISTGKSRYVIDPTGTLAVGAVTLPNTSVDGTVISISTSNIITSFTANSIQSGTVVRPAAAYTLAAGAGAEYLYRSSNNIWYKVR